MLNTFETEIKDITRDKLLLNPGDLSGDLVSGGMIRNFASSGIQDTASGTTLVVEDGRIIVETIKVRNIDSNLTIRGDVKVFGVLDAGFIRTTEIVTNQRYEKQYLEFAPPEGSPVGTGLLWSGADYNKQFVLRDNPGRFFSTENLDLVADRSYMIDGQAVVNANSLGNGVTDSNLQALGTLRTLAVRGAVNFADVVHFNPVSERFSIGTSEGSGVLTVYDNNNDVEIVITGNERSIGVIGTSSTKGLDIITDGQARISIAPGGDVTLGAEGTDRIVTRVYGKLGVGVKNPREQFEVAGNIRWANKLFAVGNQAPTEGNYQQGDIIWNSNPMARAYVGWVCTAGGSPGVWKAFGSIAE
jgi:hypothetical protein